MTDCIDISFEVLALEQEQWQVKLVTETQEDALSASVNLARSRSVRGIRVVKEIYDHSTGLSHGRTIYEQLKDKETKTNRVRMASSG
ncbi:MAG: hypothetical protein H6851_12850 [Geminicoccaceae bacterium]|nr:hypothetical protein [Geminicoccaceae bacterium]MCB9944493.1 hypothetical protein [Geminicoccaceae bacterium]